jgi:hypothetical protein
MSGFIYLMPSLLIECNLTIVYLMKLLQLTHSWIASRLRGVRGNGIKDGQIWCERREKSHSIISSRHVCKQWAREIERIYHKPCLLAWNESSLSTYCMSYVSKLFGKIRVSLFILWMANLKAKSYMLSLWSSRKIAPTSFHSLHIIIVDILLNKKKWEKQREERKKAGYRRKKRKNICHDLLSESHHHLCKEMERVKLNIHEKERGKRNERSFMGEKNYVKSIHSGLWNKRYVCAYYALCRNECMFWGG